MLKVLRDPVKSIVSAHTTRSILKKYKRRSDPWDFLLQGPVIYK